MYPTRYRSLLLMLSLVGALLPVRAEKAFAMVPATPDVLVFTGVEMAPVLPLAELLDGTPSLGKDDEMTVARGQKRFTCRAGSLQALANGQPVTLPLAPFTRGGALYAPLQPLVAALGGGVIINGTTQLVTVVMPNSDISLPLPLRVHDENPDAFRDWDYELYLVNLDGSGLKRLTYNDGNDWLPSFSADGMQCVYWYDGNILTRGVATPTLTTLLTAEPAIGVSYDSPTFSADGKWVLFSQVHTAAPQDRQVRYGTIASTGGHPVIADQTLLSWCLSPERTCIATCVQAGDGQRPCIQLMDTDGGDFRMLGVGQDPVFSPDGAHLAYTQWDAAMTTPAVCLYDLDGGNPRTFANAESPCFSANGSRLIMTRHYGAARLLVIATLTGELVEPPTTDRTGNECSADSQPVGKLLTYVRQGEGIWTMGLDRSAPRQLTTDATDWSPRFTPDGTQILFTRGEDLYAIRTDGSDLHPIAPNLIVNRYTFTPNGTQLILMAAPELAAPPR